MDPRAPLHLWHAIQDRLAAAFGISPAQREATVTAICGRADSERSGYWLQLVVATGIASLGLALDSTAVVIGGMLVSPLMGPIVELGMGLGIGSALLVLRAAWRAMMSIVVVVGMAVVLTSLLPFHEVTAEISSRTSPTVLDLVLAGFCALAAAYTTMRAGSDTASAAAGTAVAIALVPPLCVVGYGLGAGNLAVAGGSALLFTANLSAILVLAMLSFIGLGYARVPLGRIEAEALASPGRAGIARRLTKALGPALHSRFGFFVRLLMPALLVAAVFFPLQRALAEVAWQIRARSAVESALATLPATVRSSVSVTGHSVVLRLVVVGDAERAAGVRRDLEARLTGALEVAPVVDVSAVPDLDALERAAETLRQPEPPAAAPAPPPRPIVAQLQSALWSELVEIWPEAAGRLLEAHLVLQADARLDLVVLHEGAPLGEAGTRLREAVLTDRLDVGVVVVDEAVPVEPAVEVDVERGERWLLAALPTVETVGRSRTLRACAVLPWGDASRPVVRLLLSTLAAGEGRLELASGERYELRVASESPCAGAPAYGTPPPEAPEAGAGGAAASDADAGDAAPLEPPPEPSASERPLLEPSAAAPDPSESNGPPHDPPAPAPAPLD